MNGFALGLSLADQVEQLGRHDGARVLDGLGASLGDDVGGRVGTLDASEARGRPPSFDFLDLGIVEGILSLAGLLRLGEDLERVCGGECRRVRVGWSGHAGRGGNRTGGGGK